jgi:type II secretory pathway pseudopilin PulG
VFRVAAKKYDLAVIKAPDVGFAELHRRLDHFVEAHVHEFLCGAFEEMHENLARAFADEDARAEMQKAQRLIAQTTKMCMPRRPPGAEWSVYVHDLTKNATEWGVLGDDADATSPDASKTLGRATSKSGSVKAEDAARTSAESTSVEGEGVVASGDAALAEAFDPDAPVRVDLHAYAQAVIDATQNVGDFKLFKPEEAPARLTAAQFEKLLLALAWLQYGKRVARAKRAEEAAEAARAEAEARRRRELAAEEDAPNDASSSDSEKDDVPGGAAEEFVGDAARGDASPPSTTTASPADSKYATPSFAEHLREFLVDIFYKTGVLAELSEDEHDSEPDSEGDPDDWSDEEEETA